MVAITGTATVVVRDPVRQTVVAGFFGLALTLMLFAYGAPDVALSELVVATVAVPVMVLLALAKLRDRQKNEGS
ncbi:DUF4040 domain-containing protein [Baekduia soli]|uniref:DUF4040 domain-containing protein n=2 Tax=Baekduia soli TaxID=496014 RepID=A0A5B8UD08_9ACTN|nr:DUF4040 domain-containing protein [Baekduia soli]